MNSLLILICTFFCISFLSAYADRKPDTIALVVKPLPPSGGSKKLKMISWNVKRLGRESFDLASTTLLDSADVITFQEVNKSDSGLEALKQIARGMSERLKEKICMGLSEVPSEARERFAYLWKDLRLAYVKADGTVLESCPSTAITIRLGVRYADKINREPAFGTFFFRPTARQFVLASVHLLPSGKKPQLEVPHLFQTFEAISVPLVVAGDYNLDSTHSAFKAARQLRFEPALRGAKTSLKMKKRELSKPYDNFWYRDLNLTRAGVIDLYKAFPQMEARTIYNNISDHSPIVGEFEFVE